MIFRKSEKAMSPFEYLLRLAVDADPIKRGFQAKPMYIFFNIVVPVILGILLGSLMKIIEKMLRIRKKKGE
jgi:hypothetical protein